MDVSNQAVSGVKRQRDGALVRRKLAVEESSGDEVPRRQLLSGIDVPRRDLSMKPRRIRERT